MQITAFDATDGIKEGIVSNTDQTFGKLKCPANHGRLDRFAVLSKDRSPSTIPDSGLPILMPELLIALVFSILIKRIEILPASIRVHYRMGKGDFSIDLKCLKRAEGMLLEVPPPAGRHRGKGGLQSGLQSGSNTACNGGPTWNRTKN